MTYLQVRWTHNFNEEPIEMFSELDGERNELRSVERFSDGSLTFAGPDGSSGDTILSETPFPPLDQIASDPQFQPTVIDKETFERVWQSARFLVAA